MKRGSRREDPPLAPIALNWRAPAPQGGGEPAEAKPKAVTLDLLKSWITRPAEGEGEAVKASGLTAVNKATAAAASLFTGAQRFWVAEVRSSGLAAEGKDAGATCTTAQAAEDDAAEGEPVVDGAFAAMLRHLGRRAA